MKLSECIQCRQGFHKSCRQKSCECNLRSHVVGLTESDPSPTLEEEPEKEESDDDEDIRGSLRTQRSNNSRSGPAPARRLKRDATLKDQQSTGRKRAARMYPLSEDQPCEWRGQANVGGGKHPIIGCVSGLQQARHHGPDKSTSNNEEGNVHRICHRCHNRWHAANNKTYDWNNTVVPAHKPRAMTDEEKEMAAFDEFMFMARKEKAVRD